MDRHGSFQVWILGFLFAGILCSLAACSGGSSGGQAPEVPTETAPLQSDAVDYLAELKTQLNTYRSAITGEIDTGDVARYYATSYCLHGLAAGAEATGDTDVMDEPMGFIDRIMAQAKPLVRNGVTYMAWGPWDVNGNPQLLNTFQAMGPLARTVAILAKRPEFAVRYGAKADQIVAFVDQAIFKYWFDKTTGYYSDPNGPWLGGQRPGSSSKRRTSTRWRPPSSGSSGIRARTIRCSPNTSTDRTGCTGPPTPGRTGSCTTAGTCWDATLRKPSGCLPLSYQYIRTRRSLNPSLASNASRYGLMELSGTLARNVAP